MGKYEGKYQKEELKGLKVNVEFKSFATQNGKVPYLELKKIKRKK